MIWKMIDRKPFRERNAMKIRKLFLFAAVLAGFALAAAEQTPPIPPADGESSAGYPVFEWPPRIGIYIAEISAEEFPGTVGISLTGVPDGEYFGGIGFGFFGEDFSMQSVYGLWAGWYGEVQNQAGLQLGFVNMSCRLATAQMAAGANSAETCNGLQLAGLINASTDLAGFQAAGFGNLTKTANGFQLAGLLNQAEYGSGVQLALFNVTGAPLDDPDREPDGKERPGFVVQAGLENYSVDRRVFQFGLYNSKSAPGFQIGLVNYSETGLLRWMPFFNW